MPHINNGLRHIFNDATTLYDKMRPTYMPELYQAIFDLYPLGPESKALEIGIGTGQATEPILKTGCALTAVELGDQLADFSADKFKAYPNFTVQCIDFMALQTPDNAFDLVYAATAFHWIPEEAGYQKVYNLLKSGGIFARFANHPYMDKGNPALTEAIQVLYAKYRGRSTLAPEFSAKEARQLADLGEKYGFKDCSCKLFHRVRTFSGEEYPLLLNTYSDHLAMPENTRREFYEAITEAINKHGGMIRIYDTVDLELYRKP